MSRPPYPGYPPNYSVVDKLGNMHRDVIVIEILKNDGITNVDLSYLKEQIEAFLDRLATEGKVINKSGVYTSDTFDTDLRKALRTK